MATFGVETQCPSTGPCGSRPVWPRRDTVRAVCLEEPCTEPSRQGEGLTARHRCTTDDGLSRVAEALSEWPHLVAINDYRLKPVDSVPTESRVAAEAAWKRARLPRRLKARSAQ